MQRSAETILITTLAAYQTQFWIPVAQRLRNAGREVHLLAFDDRSAEMAEKAGVPVVNMYRTGLQGGAPIEEEHAFAARVAGYGLDGTNFLFSHERVTFGIRDTAALRRRFMIYTNAMEAVLDRLTAGGKRVIAVQELGGFLSVIACFYAARKRGVRNWFIEPSFFRGRLYYTLDKFSAPDTMPVPADQVSADVRPISTTPCASAPSSSTTSIITRRPSRRSPMHGMRAGWSKNFRDQFALGKHRRSSATTFGMRGSMPPWPSARRAAAEPSTDAGPTVPTTPSTHPADMALTSAPPEYLDQVDHRLPAATIPTRTSFAVKGTSRPRSAPYRKAA